MTDLKKKNRQKNDLQYIKDIQEAADALGVSAQALLLANEIGDDLPDGAFLSLVENLDNNFNQSK